MVLAVILVAVAALLAAAWLAAEHIANARLAVRRRVVVNLLSGQGLTGVLWARRGRHLLLRDAELLEPGTKPVTVDGTVLIDRAQVLFVQALGN